MRVVRNAFRHERERGRARSARVNYSLPFSPHGSSKSVSSAAPQDTSPCPPVPQSVSEQAENTTRQRGIGATARTSARKVLIQCTTPQGGCVKRQPSDVLLSRRNGSPLDTDLERFDSQGPRIKDLRELFVMRIRTPVESANKSVQTNLCNRDSRVNRGENEGRRMARRRVNA